MIDLKLNQFLNSADDVVLNVAMGNEPYRIKTQAGNVILMSEEEYKEHLNIQSNYEGCTIKEDNR